MFYDDGQLREAEKRRLLKKEKILKGLNYIVYTMNAALLVVGYLVSTGNLTYDMAVELVRQDWHALTWPLYCLLIGAVIVIFIIVPALTDKGDET